jgi:hypothetical protein
MRNFGRAIHRNSGYSSDQISILMKSCEFRTADHLDRNRRESGGQVALRTAGIPASAGPVTRRRLLFQYGVAPLPPAHGNPAAWPGP